MAETSLKPCPFCGSAHVDVVMFETHHNEMWHRAECQNCMAKSSGSKYPALAIAAWNRRATDPAVAELVEALGLAEGHLAEMLSDAKWHPIGHCPVLDRIRALLAKYAAKP